jgi:hypothetical protein
MAPFHPNRSINLQKSGDQHGTLPPKPPGLSTCKKAVINMAPFHLNRSINLQISSNQHSSLPPKPVYQPAKKK